MKNFRPCSLRPSKTNSNYIYKGLQRVKKYIALRMASMSRRISVLVQEAHFAPMLHPFLDQVLRDWRRVGQAQRDTTRRVYPELHEYAFGWLPEAGPVVRLQGVSTDGYH